MEGRIHLRKQHFAEGKNPVIEMGGLKASPLLFATGIEALRLESPLGHIVVPPDQGQRIWDAAFSGRRLTMTSFFSEPVRPVNLLDSYGTTR